MSFTEFSITDDPDDSMAAPPLDSNLSMKDRLSGVHSCLQSSSATLLTFDTKACLRCLSEACGILPKGSTSYWDPQVADWLLDPGGSAKNLHRMVKTYLPDETSLLDGLGGGVGTSSMGLTPENPGSGRFRACVEAVLVQKLVQPLNACLEEVGLKAAFEEVEMPSLALLSKMELNGMG